MKKKILFFCALISIWNYSSANIVGTNIQNFNPTSDGLDFVTVQSPETLKPAYMNFGFFLNMSGNSLPSFENDDGETLDADDRLTYADFNIAIGIMKNVDFGLSFPVVLAQTIDEDTQNVLFAENGLTEIRASLKYMFTKIKDWKGAFILSVNQNLIGNNPYTGDEAGNTINTEFAFGRKIDQFNFAFNVGYRLRNSGKEIENSIIQPLEDQWIGSGAVSKKLSGSDLTVILEILMSVPTEVNGRTTKRELSSYESLIGIKYDHSKTVASHAGVGFGLVENTASPDWRIYAGLNWTFGPLWKRSKSEKKYKAIRHKHIHSHIRSDGTTITHSHKHSHFKKTSHSKLALADHYHSRPNSFEDHALKKQPTTHNHTHSHIKNDGSVVTHSHKHSHSAPTPHDEAGLGDHVHSNPESYDNHYEVIKNKEPKRYRLENLNFKTNSAKFNKNLGNRLVKFLRFLKKKSSTIKSLTVEGHTDSVGDEYSNQNLSLRRAIELKRLITKYSNIDESIIQTRGRGETEPISSNSTINGRAKNRRVEVFVYE